MEVSADNLYKLTPFFVFGPYFENRNDLIDE